MQAKRPLNRRIIRSLFLAAAVQPAFTLAQTSGAWAVDVGTAGGSWSLASNWTGAVPGTGGTATFPVLSTFTTAPIGIIQDLSNVTVDSLIFDSPIAYQLRLPTGNPPNTITLTGSAALNVARVNPNSYSISSLGHVIAVPIAGSAGLNRTGPGSVNVTVNNTYTGGTTISDGGIFRTTVGDGAFGDLSGNITLNDGTIRIAQNAFSSARTFNIAGIGSLEVSTSASISGNITGSGIFNKSGSQLLALSSASSLNGPVRIHAGSLVLSGNGAMTFTPSILAGGSLALDNSVTNHDDRLGDSTQITYTGNALLVTGHASSPSSETYGASVFGAGLTQIILNANAAQPLSITSASSSRIDGGAAFFRGSSLGAAPGNGVANFQFTTPPALSGAAEGGTDLAIIPWAYGSTDPGAATTAATNQLVTYGANGVRPLVESEYLSTLTAGMPTHNVRLTAPASVDSPITVNALVVGSGATSVGGSSTLTISSGALLNLQTGNSISCPIDFGSSEAILHTPGFCDFTGILSGSGGLTKTSLGVATFANAANTYTGVTRLSGGQSNFLDNVPSSGPGPFGSDSSAIEIVAGGLGGSRLLYVGTSDASFDRDVRVKGMPAFGNTVVVPRFGILSLAPITLNMNGDITLDVPLHLSSSTGGTVAVHGNVSGPGFLGETGAMTILLDGSNTHSGGTEMTTGTWQIGSDSAFGSGPIRMVSLTGGPTLLAIGGPRVIANETVCFSFAGNYWTIAGSDSITFTGSINLSGSFPHNITNTGLTTYAGVAHTGGFTKNGPGTLVLSGDNIYTGSTTVGAGVLRITHSNALGTPQSPTTVSNGATLELRNNAMSSEPVTFGGAGAGGVGAIRNASDSNSIGAATLSSSATIAVDSGALATGNVFGQAAFTLTKTGPATLTARRLRMGGLNVAAGTVRVAPGRSTDKTGVIAGGLTLGAGARLDLGDNDLVVEYTALGSPLPQIAADIASAYAGGTWSGDGITSSLADASNFALGYAESSSIFTTFPVIFSGVPVDSSAVLIRFTRYGDADLDGIVNLNDFNRLAANFGLGINANWDQGDFDYNGIVNLNDFNKLAANFGLTASPGPTPEDWATLAAAVPEPGAGVALLGLAGVLATRRRR